MPFCIDLHLYVAFDKTFCDKAVCKGREFTAEINGGFVAYDKNLYGDDMSYIQRPSDGDICVNLTCIVITDDV